MKEVYDGGATRPLPRDGGEEELQGDPTDGYLQSSSMRKASPGGASLQVKSLIYLMLETLAC